MADPFRGNVVARTVALGIVLLLLVVLFIKMVLGEEAVRGYRGNTLFVVAGERDGKLVLEPMLVPQLFFEVIPGDGVATAPYRGQALTCEYFSRVYVVGESGGRRVLSHELALRCHGQGGPLYVLKGFAFHGTR